MPDFMQRRRLARMLDKAAVQLKDLSQPDTGWVAAMRLALGMSAEQVARRKGVSRNAVYQAERSEKEGSISLKQMENLAAAMGGKFVYAIVPDTPVEQLKYKQALHRAKAMAAMEPGFASLPADDRQDWIEDFAAQLLHDMPGDFWQDE